ncbi:hypothetical protein V491_08924, partial [Pseudogymnoascus sp. VKM F-3775]
GGAVPAEDGTGGLDAGGGGEGEGGITGGTVRTSRGASVLTG